MTNYLTLLKSYSCLEPKLPADEREKQELRQAILWLCGESDGENLGVCASDIKQGQAALEQYLAALGYAFTPDFSAFAPPDGAVYLKVNAQKQSAYWDSYDGAYRGVLIAVQSEDDNLSGAYGYFPLDLFA